MQLLSKSAVPARRNGRGIVAKLKTEMLEPRHMLSTISLVATTESSSPVTIDLPLAEDIPAGGQQDLELLASRAPLVSTMLEPGDANRDGRFDPRDIVALLAGGKYLTDESATWAQGDFTGDGVFNQLDIVEALQRGDYEPAAMFRVFPAINPDSNSCEVRVNNTVKKLLECVTVEGVREHQAAFQAIADTNGGVRTSGTPGYDASAQYVVDRMEAAGYNVTVDTFSFDFFQETAPPEFEQTAPNPTAYIAETDFFTMEFSGSGDVTAAVQDVDLQLPPGATTSSTSGCEAADFTFFTPGNIALIQRGGCSFFDKAANAEAAGAVAAIIFNEGQPGRTDAFLGTLGGIGVTIPTIGTSFAIGEELATASGAEARVATSTITETRTTSNVLAESTWGRDDNIVMAGAHLDSVAEGPGINDNGSGSSALLEIAEQMSKVKPRNKLRFAWWGAKEQGLLGSTEWVAQAFNSGELNDVALYLNFDMIGSPNFVRFVYDGDTQPPGSEVIEELFQAYFDSKSLATEEVDAGARSDHFAFASFGVPIGGLFTGAEVIKTAEQAAIYGGTAGDQYDPCYHLACDTFDNVSLEALDQMSDAAAFTILTYAMNTESVNGESGKGNFKPQNELKSLSQLPNG